MTHTYNITGMTCSGCQYKVQGLLSKIPGVTQVDVNLDNGTADVTMNEHIATSVLKEALKDYPKYQLSEHLTHAPLYSATFEDSEDGRSWFATYKPILLVFTYITIISLIGAAYNGTFDGMKAMSVFMAGFFITFSFFKMLDLTAFADSYAMYDIVAKKFKGWGYLYAFVELFLGLAYATDFQPLATNIITFVVMTVSIIGVLQSVLNKRKIQCACLGAVFNLPMSTVTIIEDALMIVMSAAGIIWMM
ncbi:heavy-metal-associated domain-containing protein [Mucilaginibacter hurinus]|uniref:Heavy-metal-associated domain-containing protein n=1 Tax=Mucilaginibacter hurinus TaxID=2201324 RepID=A0A367GPM6_9SPHI|nr:heavy metal-associated domain-containing protein [Mucilaginibacter hurinus]RCH55422.1 heavy-metal-associated domain-containing protein [Mucilaginibacter hurinus]